MWRWRSELNRRTRFCRPLHNHFATPPRSVGLRRPIPRARLAAPEAKLDCNARAQGAGVRRRRPQRRKKGARAPFFASPERPRKPKTRKTVNWSGKRGSNSRPQPWQGCALPTELFPQCRKIKIGTAARARIATVGQRRVVERETRFELATSTLGRLRSTN